jgi:hypothetical protein
MQASRLRVHDRVVIDDIVYEIIKIAVLKRQKHGFRKIEFKLRSDMGIRMYVCSCIDELLVVELPDIKEPDCN